jgi:ABC-2 type transport system ATP-binding protein
MTEQTVVRLDNITKRYAGHTAVSNLDLEVRRGSVYGLLGPNGAGKTTTIRMIMNIIAPDSGAVELFGKECAGRDVAHRVGYLPEERGLYRKMKVVELLIFLAQIKGVGKVDARRKALDWLERLGLGDWSDQKVDDLSKGMQQKVQFIATVLHGPELVILDEPFAGLDPVNTQVMKDIVVELNRNGTTILFSTHIMEQAEKLCDSVCIIARGEKVIDGPVADVKRGHGGRHVIVALGRARSAPADPLKDETLVAKADDYGQYAEVELADGIDAQTFLEELVRAGVRVNRFEIAEPTLNKVFIDLVGFDAARAPASEAQHHA